MNMEQYVINRLNLLEAVVEKLKAENERAQETIKHQQEVIRGMREAQDHALEVIAPEFAEGYQQGYNYISMSRSEYEQVFNSLGTSSVDILEARGVKKEGEADE